MLSCLLTWDDVSEAVFADVFRIVGATADSRQQHRRHGPQQLKNGQQEGILVECQEHACVDTAKKIEHVQGGLSPVTGSPSPSLNRQADRHTRLKMLPSNDKLCYVRLHYCYLSFPINLIVFLVFYSLVRYNSTVRARISYVIVHVFKVTV